MFKSILIANRGEIAVRVVRTCRALGVETIAIYSDADRQALHVLEANRSAYVGAAPLDESYLNIEAIVAAAVELGAEAVHPGYGLLSENADFAEAVAKAGLIFIGPPPEAIRAMGDKARARRTVSARGVPVVPGYDDGDQDSSVMLAKARKVGFPVMIKAVAGGGGRGMRLVQEPEAFEKALDAARRESGRAFGDDRLIVEKAIGKPRHVEVQVLADASGNVVHLGERECSIQRRHQKVIEESPSPVVDEELRQRMGQAAVEAARSVGYVNAGTVEFLVDEDLEFYFMEMNTRIQVEHGVTELVTGLDIVEQQLRIACGESMAIEQEDVTLKGHAVECRVYAEDPLRNYLPSAGRITRILLPTGEHVRNDVGTYSGDEISTYYDPLLCKVLTWGESRDEAIQRMSRALADFKVDGVRTNVALLRAVMAHPKFRAGEFSTDFLDTQISAAGLVAATEEEPLTAAFGALVLGFGVAGDPWHAFGPWRVGGDQRVALEHEGVVHLLEGRRLSGANEWMLSVSGRERKVAFRFIPPDRVLVDSGGATLSSRVVRTARGVQVEGRDRTFRFRWAREAGRHGSFVTHAARGLAAPMPGLVLKVLVREGEHVRTHQALIVLEAMKMEHTIEAPHDGIIKNVRVVEGGRVAEGDVLIEMEQEAAS
jgi:3-methylcrotonyl-CoA carboxylase alpha subunit